MSGFEVVGVVLGALPILISAIEGWQKGKAKVTILLRKRRYVEKLALALYTHERSLSETVKSILIGSGCKDPLRLDDDPVGYLEDAAIRDQVLDYLGEEDFDAVSRLILHSCETVKRVAMRIAGLVPTIQGPSDDLIYIIKENQDVKRKQLDLKSRVKLVFGAKELLEIIEELDRTINSLSRLIHQISSNRQALGLRTSKSALRIAKSLRRAHESASNLYSAIFHAWRGECHEGHETRLFLEDRIPDNRSCRSVNTSLAFPLVFSTIPSEKKRVWHETVVKVLYDEEDGLNTSHSVTFTITRAEPPRPQIDPVDNICAVINTASHIAFVLTKQHKIGKMIARGPGLAISAPSTKRSLKELFSIQPDRRRGAATIPLKFRMLLAFRLASNLLQLFQTHWLPNAWSHGMVFFPVTAAAHQGSNPDIDFSRPFISTPFTKCIAQLPPQPKSEPREALLELGILLLEIWHEETLETHFSLGKTPTGYYERLPLAVEWLDEMSNPPPKFYAKAASHCITGMIGGEGRLGSWDDNDFWNAVCGDIIEPLRGNCKMWR
ncbi:hypothetical protein QBC32DRAFT_267492 [Pseudoneurospora amorphoporcata]|uniref:DUF7580 domain-containing protein n=1 Tax=Pseudoneurospora amorphoporcata TaxID=241081 RepID=A0AAN6NNJ1_9PEZI|nr:hypothetical protein QBC32DRAFT_267492 [Pseudoneurospora amorphoporcata]